MKAIIMAGGEGSRLRPLTCDCPKPMTPLMDRPVMSYALELLKRHGIREAAATLHYLPDSVRDYFGDGSEFGVAMRYYVEETPLGTAGSVRRARDFLNETFVVLSGDGVTDCDLTAALKFHRERGALATLVLKRVDEPLEYGVVVTEQDGRVKRFVEKPGWGEVFSDTVNTGIYILEPEVLDRIPADRPCDFGRELFPEMLKAGLPVYGYVTGGYWCDIGDVSAYLRAHADAMEGRINLPMPGRVGGVCRMPGSRVERGAVLEGPCFIGEGAIVREGARIGACSVLGAGSIVGKQASVKRAVLWNRAQVGAGAQVRGCVLTDGSMMGEGSAAYEESVLGRGAQLGARGIMMPGVKVWPGKRIADGVRLEANVVWGNGERPAFRKGRLAVRGPAQASRVAQAYAAAVRPVNAVMARSASSVALANMLAAEAGLMAQGVQVLDAGTGTLPQLRVMMRRLHAGGAVFVDGESVLPLDETGAELSGACQRRIEQLLMRQDYDRAFAAVTKLPVPAGRSDLMYAGYLLDRADPEALGAAGMQIAVCAPNEQLLSAAECVLEKTGCAVRAEWEEEMMELAPGETGIWLAEGGEQMRLADEDGSLTESEEMLLRVWTMLEKGIRRVILPMGATRTADMLAERYGAEIIRVKGERSHYMRNLAEEDFGQLMMQFDGLYAAIQCLGMLARQGLTLNGWLRGMPKLNRRVKRIPVDWKDRGRVLAGLVSEEAEPDLTDGMCVRRGGGWVWISPSAERAECRVVTEAREAETAQELCDFYTVRIQDALNGKP